MTTYTGRGGLVVACCAADGRSRVRGRVVAGLETVTLLFPEFLPLTWVRGGGGGEVRGVKGGDTFLELLAIGVGRG